MPSRSRAKHPLDVHERALRLLAVRPRSRRELQRRLFQAGFDPDEVSEELGRLEGVGLVDDEDFARQLAEHELRGRRSGDRAAVAKLMAKGVDRATIDRAISSASAPPEEDRALEVAADRARRLVGLAPERAATRLVAYLMRRGFDPGTSRQAAARALGADGVHGD